MLTELASNVWIAPAPLNFLGLRVGTCMTVVRLKDGSLFVYSPVALAPLRDAIDTMGPVRHIVAPNIAHHLYAGEWKDAYPEATLYAAGGLPKRRKDLSFDAVLDDLDESAWPSELSAVHIAGCLLNETVFFHHDSSTLITADLIENFVESPAHWATRVYLKIGGTHGVPGMNRLLKPTFRDRKKARRAIDALLEWQPARVTLAHGELLEGDCQSTLRDAYAWLKG